MSFAVEAAALGKRFGRTSAVDGVTLSIEAGGATALVGPNGAGKTTFLRLCANLLRPTSGEIRVLGLDPRSEGPAVRRRIGFLGHESLLYPDLTPNENLLFYARLFGVERPRRRVAELVERLGLTGWAHRPVRALSRGLTQRCALARVFVHRPALLFFDEPFTGLDADARETLIELLAGETRSGTTLVMTTHDLAAAARLCHSAAVLVKGRLAWHGPVGSDGGAAFAARYQALTHPSLHPAPNAQPPARE